MRRSRLARTMRSGRSTSPNGVVLQISKDGFQTILGTYGPYTSGAQMIDLSTFPAAQTWSWRIVDAAFPQMMSHVCNFKIVTQKSGSQPQPASGLTTRGFTQQASLKTGCEPAPRGSTCVRFSDGFLWLVSDSVGTQHQVQVVDGQPHRGRCAGPHVVPAERLHR